MDSFQKAKDILKKYNQEHLLCFYDELNSEEQKALINQINTINFEQIFNLYEASKTDEEIPYSSISPLNYIDKSRLNRTDLINYSGDGPIQE